MIPGVVTIDGRLYFRRRWRAEGQGGPKRQVQYLRLPAADHPGFAEALAHARRDAPVRDAPLPGTIAALCTDFRASVRRRKLSDRTRANYLIYVDRIERDHGHRIVRELTPYDVARIRDKMADRPGTANNYLSVLRLMMAFATERDRMVKSNPVAGIKPLEIGEHEPWPAEVITAALAAATPMIRLAIITGLCGGQRIGDCIKMQHGWHDGRIMELTQQKTGVHVAIPMHPLWLKEIAAAPRKSVTILYDRSGAPYASVEPIQARIRALMASIGQGEAGYSFHGLRKNACCYLLEMGLNDQQVGSLLGMSAQIVRHYGKRARALMVADDLADRIAGATVTLLPGLRKKKASE
jgi:integrase